MTLRPADSIGIPFHGQRGGGRYPLTWGQKDIYRAFRRYSPRASFFNIRATLPVPPGTSVADVCRALRWAVEEHEALRTTYPEDDLLGPCQLLHRDGTIALSVFEAADARYDPERPLPCFGREFDPDAELPVRSAVITEDGRPAWLALEVSHLSADLEGGRILRSSLGRRLEGGGARSSRAAYQPAGRAAEEITPAGLAVSERAVAHMSRLLDSHATPVFAAPGGGHGGAGLRPRVRITSAALGAAVNELARRHRLTTATVYLAYMALIVGVLSGRSSCLFGAAASNRWLAGSHSYVGTLNQYALISVDIADADFPAVLRRVQAASLRGFGNALYDIDGLAATGHLGPLDRVDAIINNSQAGGSRALAPVPMSRISALRAQTVVRDVAPLGEPPEPLRRSIQLSVAGAGDRPDLYLCLDPRTLPAGHLGGMLTALETVAVADAQAPDRPRGPGALSAMRDALADHAPSAVPAS